MIMCQQWERSLSSPPMASRNCPFASHTHSFIQCTMFWGWQKDTLSSASQRYCFPLCSILHSSAILCAHFCVWTTVHFGTTMEAEEGEKTLLLHAALSVILLRLHSSRVSLHALCLLYEEHAVLLHQFVCVVVVKETDWVRTDSIGSSLSVSMGAAVNYRLVIF